MFKYVAYMRQESQAAVEQQSTSNAELQREVEMLRAAVIESQQAHQEELQRLVSICYLSKDPFYFGHCTLIV